MKQAGILGVVALLAGAGVACAQQVIAVAPGVVLVMPGAAAMPDPVAMMQQMDAQMAQMNAVMQAQLQQAAAMQGSVPVANGSYASVVVTSFSDGAHSCTARVVVPGNGAANTVQVSETGDGCASLGVPGAVPARAPLRPVPLPASVPGPRKAAPLVVAENN
jgi:hypothetical protein